MRLLSRFTPLLLLLLLPVHAWAKKVSVHWKPMKGAISYEIVMVHDGKTVLKDKIENTGWAGELDFGVYAYQIRAYDRVKRAGAWSPPHALVVMPKGPDTVSPSDGEKIVSYTPTTHLKLKWNAVQGAEKYHLVIKNGDTVAREESVHGTETDLRGLPAGKYTWEVSVELQAQGRGPASFGGKKWDGKPGSRSEFALEQAVLKSPELVYPEGAIRPTADGKLDFQWRQVAGAEAYEIRVAPKRMRAGQPQREVKWVVRSNTSTTARIPGQGSYTWKVRALAGIDSSNTAEAVGAESSTEFKLDRNAGFTEHSGFIALSSMVAPYSYSANSPGLNSFTQGHLNSTAVTARVSGEYWVEQQRGVQLMVQDTAFTINSENFDRKDVELEGKYRTMLNDTGYPWTLIPKFGILLRDYVLLTATPGVTTSGTMSADKFMTLGPNAGFDLRKQFTERFSLGAQFSYYLPVMSSEGKIQRGSDSNRNYSLGVQGLYWLTKVWGLGMGVLFENRSIANINPSRTAPDSINMDGTYLFGSLIYSFGQ